MIQRRALPVPAFQCVIRVVVVLPPGYAGRQSLTPRSTETMPL